MSLFFTGMNILIPFSYFLFFLRKYRKLILDYSLDDVQSTKNFLLNYRFEKKKQYLGCF